MYEEAYFREIVGLEEPEMARIIEAATNLRFDYLQIESARERVESA
jgi:hypothetical protein